jgi:general secretion pathway protein G
MTHARPFTLQQRTASARVRGFTLIEIMVVVVIIGLLAALVVPNLMGRVGQASVTKAKADVQAIETALTMYKLDNFNYPSSGAGLLALVQKPSDDTAPNWRSGGYLKRIPRDPWGNEYQYAEPGTHGGEFDLYSFGADKQQGGEGENADIGNWNLDQNPSR